MNIKNDKEGNIRHLPLYLLLTAAAGRTLPALVSSEAVPDDALAAVAATAVAKAKVAITGRIDPTTDRGHKVFIEFLVSPKLTAAVRTSLTSSDFGLVDICGQADAVYELDGAFQALCPATRRTTEVRMGDYIENPTPLATKSGRDGSVTLSLNSLIMLIGAITSNVENTTGTQDSINVVTAGDPNNKCLPRCETWRYRQCNVASLTCKEDSTEQKYSVLATAEGTKLVPA